MSEPPSEPHPRSSLRRGHRRLPSRDVAAARLQDPKLSPISGVNLPAALDVREREREREHLSGERNRDPPQTSITVDPGPPVVIGVKQNVPRSPPPATVTVGPAPPDAHRPREAGAGGELASRASGRRRPPRLPQVDPNRSLPSLPKSPASPVPQPVSSPSPAHPPPTFHHEPVPHEPVQAPPVATTRPAPFQSEDPPFLAARRGDHHHHHPHHPNPRYIPVPPPSPDKKSPPPSPDEKAQPTDAAGNGAKSPSGDGSDRKSSGFLGLFHGAPPSPPLPPTDSTKTVSERLHQTVQFAHAMYERQAWLERFFSLGINATILAQLLIAATITILSAVPVDYKLATAILGAIATLLAGLLARYRGTNQPERAGATATAMRAFLNECDAVIEDYGDNKGSEYDATIRELRAKLEIIMENAEKAAAGRLFPLQASTAAFRVGNLV